MKYVVLTLGMVICVGAIMSLQCGSRAGRDAQPASKEQETKVVDVRIVEVVQPPGEAWKDFQGVLKCVILDPKGSKLTKDQQLNVVAARPEAAKKGMFVHRGSNLSLEKGAKYTISVEDRLPKGWQSIKGEFEDERIGLIALVAVEKIDRTGAGENGYR
jgi:hypothetical protein